MHRDNQAVKIADVLRSRLQENFFAAGKSMPSTRRLALEFGVSHQTVSRALMMLADERLLQRRRNACFEVRMRRNRMRVACMISTDYSQAKIGLYSDVPYQVQLLLDELTRCQCDYRIFNFYDLRQANFSPRIFDGFDGLIAAKAFSDINSRQLVNEFAKPKVWIWNNEPFTDGGNQVIPDFMSGYSELFSLARKKGIRHCVLHCSRQFFADVMTNALRLNNWSDDEFTIEMHTPPETQLKAYKYALKVPAADDILHVCSSDIFACGFVEAFLDRKFRPGEFHVSGTGNIESAGYMPLGEPWLTTLHTDRKEMILKSVECLQHKILNDDLATEIIRIKSRLVIRKSAL